ncbi:MAG: cell division protein FtsA [candidate division WOR-3 bacterium]|nr:cell division protein FtsA [candidate division WOR-3 bacterium]MCX7837608.1 cell division protein FtsA [candidate division WOR-3 bacterium]MDW8113357.1 cell division protein FtsA [candidate division WOR-3 bacterium]
MEKKIITALDLGITTIKCLISEIDQQERINILGFGEVEAKGFNRGVVVDSEKAFKSLESVFTEVEQKTKIKVKKTRVIIGLQGEYIKELRGESSKDDFIRPVQEEDIMEVKRKAQRISLPSELMIWQLIPLEYVIDGVEGIKQPLKRSVYNKLTLKALLLTIPRSSLKTFIEIFQELELRKFELVFQNAVIGLGVCEEEELNRGVAVLDIGGGVNFGIYKNGEYQTGFNLPFGGVSITNDIAIVFLTPFHYAEKIKKEYGMASRDSVTDDLPIEIINHQEERKKRITKSQLSHVIECRLKEILYLAKQEYEKLKEEKISLSSIVVTGGVANTPGITKLVEEFFSLPARVGFHPLIKEKISPSEFVNPKYATLIGLIEYKLKKKDYLPVKDTDFFDKIKSWMKKRFTLFLGEE